MVESVGNREKLLHAGVDLLAGHRFTHIKMEEVAARAGVTKPMVYYYFGSKNGFYEALVEYMLDYARRAFKDLLTDSGTVRDALKRFMMIRFRLQSENKTYTAAWYNLRQEGWRLADMKLTGSRFFQEVFQPVFERAIRNGEIRPDIKPELVIGVLASVIEGVLDVPHKEFNTRRRMEQLVDDVTDLVFNGIKLEKGGHGV